MTLNKRTSSRITVPLAVEFRTTYGAREYAPGLIKNISCRGIAVEACFLFIQYENLDIKLYFPQSGTHISLNGDVLWKKQDGIISRAGIKFKKVSGPLQHSLVTELSRFTGISVDAILSSNSTVEKAPGQCLDERVYSKVIGM